MTNQTNNLRKAQVFIAMSPFDPPMSVLRLQFIFLVLLGWLSSLYSVVPTSLASCALTVTQLS